MPKWISVQSEKVVVGIKHFGMAESRPFAMARSDVSVPETGLCNVVITACARAAEALAEVLEVRL